MITITPKTNIETAIEPLAVDTKTAAHLLGVSDRTVRELARTGKIAQKKVGWRSLYPMASIKRFLETDSNEKE